MHESLCNLTELTALSLYQCDVEAIDPCISNLRNLRKLDLSYNKLAEVRPTAVSCLAALHSQKSTAIG